MTSETGEWKPTVAQLRQLIANHQAMKSHPDNEDTLELAVFGWTLKNLDRFRQVEKAMQRYRQAEVSFDACWDKIGQYIDPDTSDVLWFDKRRALAQAAYEAGLK